ncbi:MAG: hypothetical protein DWQ19_10090 [Crenarchaeota archaeon]|nr:MAG: hypothetical protein DWQ19_10090 [Thermoproteota archaeon]
MARVYQCTKFCMAKKFFSLFPYKFQWKYRRNKITREWEKVESGFIVEWLCFYWCFEELPKI